MIDSCADAEEKARHLRRLYRRHAGDSAQVRIVQAEYRRLFSDEEVGLDHILVNVWREARELAGWKYDRAGQCWRRADGSRVNYDDGSEWRHL